MTVWICCYNCLIVKVTARIIQAHFRHKNFTKQMFFPINIFFKIMQWIQTFLKEHTKLIIMLKEKNIFWFVFQTFGIVERLENLESTNCSSSLRLLLVTAYHFSSATSHITEIVVPLFAQNCRPAHKRNGFFILCTPRVFKVPKFDMSE